MLDISTIEVPLIKSINADSSIKDIAIALNNFSKHSIDHVPWSAFSYKPECEFAIAHHNSCIFLKFFISEDAVLAQFTQPNDLVYQDSCVEFFIAFNGEEEYYNLEFNCIGTCYLGYGKGKLNREEAQVDIIQKIKSSSFLYSDNGKIKWELTVMIPNEVFYHNTQPALLSNLCKANFYKCGDDLPTPHYLSWNNIKSDTPNFHLSNFFGNLNFNQA